MKCISSLIKLNEYGLRLITAACYIEYEKECSRSITISKGFFKKNMNTCVWKSYDIVLSDNVSTISIPLLFQPRAFHIQVAYGNGSYRYISEIIKFARDSGKTGFQHVIIQRNKRA